MEQKKILRKKFTEIRKSVKSDEKDSKICVNLLMNKKLLSADKVLLYASFGYEVDTWLLFEYLLGERLEIAYPKCGENGKMTFHFVKSSLELQSGIYGIREPDENLPQPVLTDNTVCIVPGLAFTEKGVRLGYGGGYYDRFLSANPQVYTIALAYESQITDSLPTESQDINVNAIVTEERTINCNE